LQQSLPLFPFKSLHPPFAPSYSPGVLALIDLSPPLFLQRAPPFGSLSVLKMEIFVIIPSDATFHLFPFVLHLFLAREGLGGMGSFSASFFFRFPPFEALPPWALLACTLGAKCCPPPLPFSGHDFPFLAALVVGFCFALPTSFGLVFSCVSEIHFPLNGPYLLAPHTSLFFIYFPRCLLFFMSLKLAS